MELKMSLLIIDMQPEFKAAYVCLDSVVAATKQAVKNHRPIVALEYRGAGETMHQIKNVVKDYPLFKTITKCNDDGSREAINAFTQLMTPKTISSSLQSLPLEKVLKHIQVCGVNTCWCVQYTINSLIKKLPNVKFSIKEHETACKCKFDYDCWEAVAYSIERQAKES